MTKKMTLEILAKKIDSGFAKMEEKFEGVGQEFEKVYEKFDSLEKSVSDRFHVMGDELRGQQDKMARVETVLKIG